MTISIVVLVLFTVPTISAQYCLDWETVPNCYNDDHNCQSPAIWESNGTVCGACGGCTRSLVPGFCEECNKKDDSPCQPGYTCSGQCKPAANTCYEELYDPCIHYTPVCVGWEYAPRQCKGARALGRCFCVNLKGERIFGESVWSKAENMTCACSRRVEELKANGRTDVTLHCNQMGNYEALQCDDDLCWCADEKTGVATSRILPETMMTMLHCYNETEIGSQYLRICESKDIAQLKLDIELNYHGTYNANFAFLRCDRDGTFGAVQLNGNQLQCTWKDNGAISGYAAGASELSNMNCRCARDKTMYPEIQLVCNGNGNYQPDQTSGSGETYTVDSDGFATTQDCKATFKCSDYTTSTTTTPKSTTTTPAEETEASTQSDTPEQTASTAPAEETETSTQTDTPDQTASTAPAEETKTPTQSDTPDQTK